MYLPLCCCVFLANLSPVGPSLSGDVINVPAVFFKSFRKRLIVEYDGMLQSYMDAGSFPVFTSCVFDLNCLVADCCFLFVGSWKWVENSIFQTGINYFFNGDISRCCDGTQTAFSDFLCPMTRSRLVTLTTGRDSSFLFTVQVTHEKVIKPNIFMFLQFVFFKCI